MNEELTTLFKSCRDKTMSCESSAVYVDSVNDAMKRHCKSNRVSIVQVMFNTIFTFFCKFVLMLIDMFGKKIVMVKPKSGVVVKLISDDRNIYFIEGNSLWSRIMTEALAPSRSNFI